MKNIYIFILLFFSFNIFSQNGASTCSVSEPMCSDNNGVKIFNNVTGSNDAGQTACLDTTPNSAWFYIKVDSPGDLKFQIIQSTDFDANSNPTGTPIDVDFAAWGPFTSSDSNCSTIAKQCKDSNGNTITCPSNIDSPNFYINNLDNTNIIDCSYSAETRETFSINNAQAGQFYLLLITNFDNVPGKIKLEQTNFSDSGSGATDCTIISGELGADQTVCNGKTITLDGTPTNGTVTSYEWQINTGTGFTTIAGETNATLVINNNKSGTYRVIIKDSNGATGTDDVVINFLPVPSATKPADIFFCDVDNDGFNSFDLQTDVTPLILNGKDPAIFDIVYYLSQTDADNNTTANALTNPYTNPTAFSNQTIYARMHNKVAPNACFDTTSFKLVVTGKPVPQTPTNYERCDDTISGGDTDGFFNNFVLNTKDAEILGVLSTTTYEVSYHTTLVGAQTSNTTNVIDKNTPYRNVTANSQTIYVRVENKNNAACNDTTKSFQLVVNPLPVIANNIVTLEQCDTDSDLNTVINLTLAQKNISTNNANETFKYYPTENDAINDTAEITNQTAHPVSNGTSVWVRTISNKTCYRISRINIVVGFSADVNYSKLFATCDDFLDADGNNNANNNDTDGITFFDISAVETDIKALPIFSPAVRPNLEILIFESIADRDAVRNVIQNPSNYRNKNVPAKTVQTLYVKIIDKTNNDCQGLGSFTILVQQPPIANKPANGIDLCDDFASGSFTDGINNGINLRDKVSEILGTTQSTNDYTVTFHTTPANATSGNAPITNDTNYTNQTSHKQTIYIRVENKITKCYNDHENFDIIINPLPIITKAITPLEICDTGVVDNTTRNGLEQKINLGQKDTEILNAINDTDKTKFIISYHRTRNDASDGSTPFNKADYYNDTDFTTVTNNIGEEKIWISVFNKDTKCRYGITPLIINIYPEPNIPNIANFTHYIACDNTSDSNQDDTNGINGDIALNSKISEVLKNYPTNEHSNFKVTFHGELAHAQAGTNPLNGNKYQNTSNNQPIYVRVLNTKTSCVNDDLSFNIIINPLPSFTINAPEFVCLDNPTVTNDNVGATLTINAANINNYTYKWTLKNNPTSLGTDPFLKITKGGTYVVTATMKGTTGCYKTKEVTIKESISPILNDDDIVIIDDTNNSGLDTYSIKIITDNQNLGIGGYQFELNYTDDYGTLPPLRPFQDEPLFENITGGLYTVVVNDKNGCRPNAILEISVIQYPKFLTPNGDGKNDTWKIKGANSSFYHASNITVVDRHGKIVAIIPIDSDGWDGTYNGKTLPSNDYWFKIQLIDRKGKIHQHQGHFSLIRR